MIISTKPPEPERASAIAETMKKPEGTDWYPELLARETTARENTPDNVVNIASKITLGEVVILPVNETPPKGAA